MVAAIGRYGAVDAALDGDRAIGKSFSGDGGGVSDRGYQASATVAVVQR